MPANMPTPIVPMLNYPLYEGGIKTDIVSYLLALNPLMLENLALFHAHHLVERGFPQYVHERMFVIWKWHDIYLFSLFCEAFEPSPIRCSPH